MFNLPIPNLLNGISQQPPPVRFPTQAERQVNAYSSPVEGLTKRFPTEHVSKMADDSDPGYDVGSLGYKFHLIDRGDGIESYAVLARKAPSPSCTACVKIYDLKNNGAEVPVLYAGPASSYMVGTPETAYRDIELVSIADYTFIVNRSKTVEMSNATSPTNTSEGAILWVAGAGYGQTYTVKLKLGTQAEATVTYTTSDTSFHNQPVTVDGQTFPDKSSTIDSSYIAAKLKEALEANATIAGGYDITRNGFSLFIKPKVAGTTFTINVSDGESGNDLRIAKDFVNRFEDLPIQAPHNFVIKVAGLPEEDRDDYYVKFVQSSLNTSVPGSGEWEETVAPGILTTINAGTMPHGLIRYFDDNDNPFFVFKAFDGQAYSVNGNPLEGSDIAWGTRKVGDTQTNPLPSFLGQTISDIFIFKNRLGFLSGESVILSESGEYFNFFRTSVTTLLDSDVIDVGSAYPGITLFHAAVPYLDRLILFADKVQMAIQASNGPLSPKTVSLSVVSNYDYLRAASPAPVNDLIFFAFNRGGFSGIRNMQVSQDDSNILTAVDVSAHIPQYIAGQAIYMEASAHDNVLVVLADSDPSKLYIYKWFDNERSRVQSSWSEWSFERGEVIGFGWEGSTLWVAFRRPEGIYLEKMIIEPDRKDADSEFVVRLDRRAQSCPYLEGNVLWVDYPYVVDAITYGGGNFIEVSANNVSYQSLFDAQPPALVPSGEIFHTVEDLPEAGNATLPGTYDGFVDLPDVSGEAYFNTRLSFSLAPGTELDVVVPALGIDVNTGYVNTTGRTNSFKIYLLIRQPGNITTLLQYGTKTVSNGVLAGQITGGWDFSETVGLISGSIGFQNASETDTVAIEVVIEKAVDLIPDVLVYDDSNVLKYSVRPGLANGEITNETMNYLIGESLFRTSPLSAAELVGYTPPAFDPNAGYRADQWSDGPLPPGYAANDSAFFAMQDDGDLCIGLYLRGAQTITSLTATSVGNNGFATNTGLPEYPTDESLTTGISDNTFVYKGMTSGDSATFSISNLGGNASPFRWLSFTGKDTTVLGYGVKDALAAVELPKPYPTAPTEYLLLNKGPLNMSGGIVSAMNQAFNSIVDAEGDEAAVLVFYGYDQDTFEAWVGFAIRIVGDGPNDISSKLRVLTYGAVWGNTTTSYYTNLPGTVFTGTTYPAFINSFAGPSMLNVDANKWFGMFATGPFTAIAPSSVSYTGPGNFTMTAEIGVQTKADSLSQDGFSPWGDHNNYWADVKYYAMTYNYSTGRWEIGAKLTADNPTLVLGGSSAETGDRSNPFVSRKVDPTFSQAISEVEWGDSSTFGDPDTANPLAVVNAPTPIYPTWWSTEESSALPGGVSVYRAVVAPGVSSIPVVMGTWALNHNGALDPDVIVDFPYSLVFQAGASGVGAEDAGISPEIYYDANGIPQVELTAEGTRIRLVYPLEGGVTDLTDLCFWVGVPYTMEYEFSTPYLRQNENTVTTGRMQIRNMSIEYDKAGYFEVEVYDRETGIFRYYEKEITLGYTHSRFPLSSGLGTPNLTNGSFKFPVLIRNTNCRVTLRNSSVVPARFLSAEIEASYDSRARRI
jgi:hypothetical protein